MKKQKDTDTIYLKYTFCSVENQGSNGPVERGMFALRLGEHAHVLYTPDGWLVRITAEEAKRGPISPETTFTKAQPAPVITSPITGPVTGPVNEKAVPPAGETIVARETIFEEANRIIHGERRSDYGAAHESFARIAIGWSEILEHSVTPTQVALCMTWLKIARFLKSNDRDSLVDLCGYTGLAAQLEGLYLSETKTAEGTSS